MPSKRFVNVRQAAAIEELAARLARLEEALARVEEKLDALAKERGTALAPAPAKKPAAEK